ncbi:hypothetical protein FA15DRAFT_664855 [Coprinopsis marcescibilis]|uniref:DUF302 domain-containing protein n=1 Tax=Coprinopsis marcescibilis TaxID=230819 RepID=A0A5C3L712_COPMA|nr:hypothetical protein FA15DRAFT_664855 [Coprinopsis marcescibilis]
MSRELESYSATLVTHRTKLSFAEATSRLEKHLGVSPGLVSRLPKAANEDEFTSMIESTTLDKDFLLFTKVRHHDWMRLFSDTRTAPNTALYTIGNPLIARKIFQQDVRAACAVPIRLLLTEGQGGTDLVYHLPSSLLPQSIHSRSLFKELDAKLESLILKVLQNNTSCQYKTKL